MYFALLALILCWPLASFSQGSCRPWKFLELYCLEFQALESPGKRQVLESPGILNQRFLNF